MSEDKKAENLNYIVQISIDELKNLLDNNSSNILELCVKLTVFGQSKIASKVKFDNFINENFYFVKENLSKEKIEEEKIMIEVYDPKNTEKKDMLGIYELNLAYVFNQKEHCLKNYWIGLTNPESDDISKIGGFLKVSISILYEGKQELEKIKKEEENKYINTSQLNKEYKQISLYFFRGEYFGKKNINIQKSEKYENAYLEVKYMGITQKTKQVSGDENDQNRLKWNQKIDIPVSVLDKDQNILIQVKCSDKDELIGSASIKVEDVLNEKYNNIRFLEIYKINNDKNSCFKGIILFKCLVSDLENDFTKVSDIPMEMLDEALKQNRKYCWKIMIRIISAMFLPVDNGEYGIRISIGEKGEFINHKNISNGSINFNKNTRIILNTFADDLFELPEMFIYLVDKSGKNVSYQRLKLSEFHLNKGISIIKLIPFGSTGLWKDIMNAGIIKCKICVHRDKEIDLIPSEKEFNQGGILEELLDQPSKKKVVEIDDLELELMNDVPKPASQQDDNKNKFNIIGILNVKKDLIDQVKIPNSEIFIAIKYGEKNLKVDLKNINGNNMYTEKFEFKEIKMSLDDITTWPIFQVSFVRDNKDKDTLENIGYNYIWLFDSSYALNDTQIINPKFLNLKSLEPHGLDVLLNFYALDEEHKNLISNINIKQEESKVENINTDEKLIKLKNLITINFISSESDINCSLKCLPNDMFAKIEAKLYEIYKDYRNTNNTFMVNNKEILRFKTIAENGILDGDKVQLVKK